MSKLYAEQLFEDDDVKKAFELIKGAIINYQNKIKFNQKPLKKYVDKHKKNIELLEKSRGSKLVYPYLGSGFGSGALVEMTDGSVKYDFISGIGAHWGHMEIGLIEETLKGALQDTIMQGNLQHNLSAENLISLFTEKSGFDHCFLTTSGAMALENALKIAFQKNHLHIVY